ncbi:MAG: ATP-binding cassette domain-containing protein, partial [Schleiferiaceae bacterium]|nr:ATP-binding cassette domain-containing protein [Schleiferiaceae bacterium]
MIQVNNVSFHYRKNQSLIKHLDLELNKGSIYGLLGLNGSGKTTLLKLMTGMLFPQEGEVTLSNLNVKSRTPNLNSRLFFIPDVLQLPPIKGRSFIRDYSVFYPKFDQEAMGLGLELFNVSANSNLKDLSHGAKKKFLIAFALATNTEYLIMDEPTNGLDIPSKSSFRKLLASSISDEKLFLISSHQINDLNNIIDP